MKTRLVLLDGTEDVQVMVYLRPSIKLSVDQRNAIGAEMRTFARRCQELSAPGPIDASFAGRVRQIVREGKKDQGTPLCPKCQGPMHERTNTRDGTKFWGCKAYPQCRGTRSSYVETARRNSQGVGFPFPNPDSEAAYLVEQGLDALGTGDPPDAEEL